MDINSNYPRKDDLNLELDVTLGTRLLTAFYRCDQAFFTLSVMIALFAWLLVANSYNPGIYCFGAVVVCLSGANYVEPIIAVLATSNGWSEKQRRIELRVMVISLAIGLGVFLLFRLQSQLRRELTKYGIKQQLGWFNRGRARKHFAHFRQLQLGHKKPDNTGKK